MSWREFKFERKGKVSLVWRIKQDGESYSTQHGQLNGAMQEFSDTPGPKGKENTKAYVSAVDNCHFHMLREIRKKEENGYIEYVNGEPVKEQITALDFNTFLPKSFCCYKPQTDISDNALKKIHKSGKARYSRKLDGMCHIAAKHPWGWEIYTRRMDLASRRFPNHIALLNSKEYKVGTIFTGEMVCVGEDGKENFKDISRICRSLPQEARQLVKDKEVNEPTYVIFDMIYHNGSSLKNTSYKDRRELWENVFDPGEKIADPDVIITTITEFKLTPETWEGVAKENDWEGFVVVDENSIPGDKFYSFNGKPKRPKGHHKLKPIYEADVVVYASLAGSGKRLQKIGSLFVKQKHPVTGEWVALGKCGSGLTDEDINEFMKRCDENDIPHFTKEKDVAKVDLSREENLLVVEIRYNDRLPETNMFRFSRFLRFRDDKGVEECYAERWKE